jgi:uncharacterized protein YkwD
LTLVRIFWLPGSVRRLPYLVTAALVALVLLATGGYVARRHPSGSDADQSSRVSSVQIVAQGAPADAPSGSPSGSTAAPSSVPTPAPSGVPATSRPATPKPTRTTATAPASSSAVVDQLLAQINQLRADNGLPPYTLLSGLNASAHKHNVTMMGGCGLSHQCPGEASLGARVSAQGVKWSSCGENIGYSGPHSNSTAEIVKAAEGLTTSMYNEKPPNDGHRRNLLSTSFHHVGIDVVRDSSGRVWLTQDFSS